MGASKDRVSVSADSAPLLRTTTSYSPIGQGVYADRRACKGVTPAGRGGRGG